MKCPYCGFEDQKVLDSRPAREGEAIRRRRECLSCDRRFTTFEAPEMPRLFVVKRGGGRQEFDREKMLNSMIVACGKRPVGLETLRSVAERTERDVFQEFEDEVPSSEIGERVMRALRGIDTIAYVRFASVYREFATITDFQKIVQDVEDAGEKALGVGRQALGADGPEALGAGRQALGPDGAEGALGAGRLALGAEGSGK